LGSNRWGTVPWLALLAASSAHAQWLPGFTYREAVDVTATAALNDYQVLVTLDTAAQQAAGRMRAGCADVRFTAADGVSVLPHWLESGCGTAQARFWVRVPTLATTTRLYVYFGSGSAPDVSDGYGTNLFYEPFDTDPDDGGRWTAVYRYAGDASSEWVWGNGEQWLTTLSRYAGGGATFMQMDASWDDSWALSFRYRAGGGDGPNDGGDGLAFGFFHQGNNGAGGSLGVQQAGYAVEVDALLSTGDPSPEHIAVTKTVSTSDSYSHLAVFDTPKVKDDVWHSVLVGFNQSRITVDLDDAGILDYSGAWNRTYRRMLFGAGTGLDDNLQRIDDVVLRKFVRPEPVAAIGTLEATDAGDTGTGGGAGGGSGAGGGAPGDGGLPQFVAPTLSTAACGKSWQYPADGGSVAQGGGPITYRLEAGPNDTLPSGLAVDSSTGALSWTPTSSDEGLHEIIVVATNASGSSQQTLDVAVFCHSATMLHSGCSCTTPGGAGVVLLLLWARRRRRRD
jgi:hypothetical protein